VLFVHKRSALFARASGSRRCRSPDPITHREGTSLSITADYHDHVAIAVHNVWGRRRWSKLGEWLRPRARVSRQIDMAG